MSLAAKAKAAERAAERRAAVLGSDDEIEQAVVKFLAVYERDPPHLLFGAVLPARRSALLGHG